MSPKKILVVTPRFPYPETGADEQDRAEGIRQLKRLGYEVQVVAKYFAWQDSSHITQMWSRAGVPVTLVPYKYKKATETLGQNLLKFLFTLTHPWYLDGSTLEYQEPAMRRAVDDAIKQFAPDLVCFDYTYLWPLYSLARKRRIPIAVRPINFEADHFLDEDRRTLGNYLKYIPKYFTEVVTAHRADVLFAITPVEQEKFEKAGAKRAVNLPLRALWKKIGTHVPRETEVLHVFFSGSTYSVAHNRRALEFVLRELAPAVLRKFGPQFIFHITGAKFPAEFRSDLCPQVVYEDMPVTIEAYEQFLAGMDIAVAPSFFGAGMQQKIFEPLTRGFPTITNARGMAGYPFIEQEEVLLAETAHEYAHALERLTRFEFRQKLSDQCKRKSAELFSQPVVDSIVFNAIESL